MGVLQPPRLIADLLNGLGPEDGCAARRRLSTIRPVELIESTLASSSAWYLDEMLSESYLHANGFYKISFPMVSRSSARVRLHVWPGGRKDGMLSTDPDVHNHKWPFASRVLAGSFSHSILAMKPDGSEYVHFRQITDAKYGYSFKRIGPKGLAETPAKDLRQGAIYSMAPMTIHKVSAQGDYGATLVIELPRTRCMTDVFVAPDGGKPENVRVSPRLLSPSQIITILADLLSVVRHTSIAVSCTQTCDHPGKFTPQVLQAIATADGLA
jgi:hypothetical protein